MSDTDFNAKPTELDADEAETNAEAGLNADPSDALAPLDQVIAERDDWKDRALRVAAEMENLKRRSETQQNDARAFAIQRFAKDLLGDENKVEFVAVEPASRIPFLQSDKVDLILLNAVDPKGVAPVVKKARDAGIVVVAVDVGAEGVDYTVMSDNVAAGANACDYIVKKLNGKGSVVIVNGPPVTSVTDRVVGCKQVFAKNSGIKVLSDNQDAGGSRDGGMRVMQDLLTANPKIDAVFAINDPTGIGAELAIKQAKRTGIFITAVDGAPDAVVALKDPNSLFEGSSAQNPYQMANDGVKVGFDIMNGKAPKDKVKLLPVPLVTKANLKDYPGWVKE